MPEIMKMRAFQKPNLVLTAIATLFLSCCSAVAADICQAVVLRDVPAVENPSRILHKGEIDRAVTQYNVNIRTGEIQICSHGGYCYPLYINEGGNRMEALRLTNCKPSAQPYSITGGFASYGLDPIRSVIPKAELRYNDLDDTFSRMGLCSACADNVAQYVIQKPESQCATLARSALEGNPDSISKLRSGPDFCMWHYPADN